MHRRRVGGPARRRTPPARSVTGAAPNRWSPAGTRRCRTCTWPRPAARHPSANSAACWSTARPTTGTSGPNTAVVPTGSAQLTISGSSSVSMPKICGGLLGPRHAVEVEQQRTRRGGGVGDEGAAEPMEQPRVGGRRHAIPGDVLAQPGDLRRDEVRVELQAGERGQRVGACAASRSHTVAARRSCQTSAGVVGEPVARSHASTVSPWFARPTASTGQAAASTAAAPASTTDRHSSSGSCSTPPPSSACGWTATSASPRTVAVGPHDERLRRRRALVDRRGRSSWRARVRECVVMASDCRRASGPAKVAGARGMPSPRSSAANSRSMASSSSREPCTRGPVNQLWAESRHQSQMASRKTMKIGPAKLKELILSPSHGGQNTLTGPYWGSTKRMSMIPTQTMAVQPTSLLHRPRFHGPGRKSGLRRRSRTGVTYAVYRPMLVIATNAKNATE